MTQRWKAIAAGAPLVLLVLAGCGQTVAPAARPATGTPPPSTQPLITGTERPVPITGPQPGILDDAAIRRAIPDPAPALVVNSPRDALLAQLKQRTLRMAGVSGAVTGSCDRFSPEELDADCATTYQGVAVQWSIDMMGSPQQGFFMSSSPVTAVLTARRVYDEFWKQYHTKSDQLRCDRIPPVISTPVSESGRATSYRCQYLGPPDGRGHRTWIDLQAGADTSDTVKFFPQSR